MTADDRMEQAYQRWLRKRRRDFVIDLWMARAGLLLVVAALAWWWFR